jgi:hypothetical protein
MKNESAQPADRFDFRGPGACPRFFLGTIVTFRVRTDQFRVFSAFLGIFSLFTLLVPVLPVVAREGRAIL